MPFDPAALVASFRAGGGWYDGDAMDLVPIDGMGWGAVARRHIEPHTPLFHIPLPLLLTPWTSALRTYLSEAEWDALDGGWARLILCMMWEESRAESKWAGYLANMPKEFDAPMFWSEEERRELVGTDIEDRIGKEDAEAEYTTKLAPVIAAHPDLFPSDSGYFSLAAFHVQGSRILSRSFTVPISRAGGPARAADDDEDSDDDDEEEEVAVMVPMADMLNAAYERDNARLFADGEDDEEVGGVELGEGYTMMATVAIAAGEQIYNTYASPPNSELLRKYGHVDTLPLPSDVLALLPPETVGGYPLGNAGDEVEIAGDAVVRAVGALLHASDSGWAASASARVDFWLDEGQDDTFGLNYTELPPALVAFIRLLSRDEDWERAQRKGKLPGTSADSTVLDVLERVVADRAGRYPQTIEEDLATIAGSAAGNKRNAAVVRLGEKRVLAATRRMVEMEREKQDGKRKAKSEGGSSKRRK